ncbi:MAG: hypothetical protein R3C45_09675 [Phycisphaerales bacterium]
MHSWVRYSVSVYLGLLLAGSIASPGISARPAQPPMASVYQRQTAPTMRQAPIDRAPIDRADQAPARTES